MQQEDIKSIAILRLSALGDVCMTIPLVRTLQQGLPHAKIYWIISRPLYAFVKGLTGVHFIVIDKPGSLKAYVQCYRELKPYQFDVLLVPQASLRTNFLCPLINANIKYGFGRLHSRDAQRLFVHHTVCAVEEHLVDSFLRFTEPLGVREKVIDWQLPIGKEDSAWAKEQLSVCRGPWLAVCPSASQSERNWSLQRYVQTINELKKRWAFNVLLVGGSNDEEQAIARKIEDQLDAPCLNLVGKSTLKKCAALLGSVDALLSPDTGPLHLAVAVDTPVVGLYAVASPEKTGPYFSRQWTVNKYPEAVQSILGKDPNKVSWRQRVHSPQAMLLITVDDVLKKLDALFCELKFPLKAR